MRARSIWAALLALFALTGCDEPAGWDGGGDADGDQDRDVDPDDAAPDDADHDTVHDGGDADAVTDADPGVDADPEADGDRDLDVDPDGPRPAAWRIERPPDSVRTWLVSPSGERTFLLGVNTVMRDASCDGIRDHWIRRATPTETARAEWARLSDGECGGRTVASPYCFNAVGAFSETNDFDSSGGDSYLIRPLEAGGGGAPYLVVLSVAARGDDRTLRDVDGTPLRGGFSETRIGDPFNPAFRADLEEMAAARAAPRRGDPRLVMYFAGNEIGLFDRAGHGGQGVRDFRRWLWSDCPAGSSPAAPTCARHALAGFLAERYGGDLAALNIAWESDYPGADFAVIVDVGPRPVPYVAHCNLTCREDLQQFVHDRLLRAWVDVVTTAIRAADPDHLVATPRLALATSSSYRFWTPASQPEPDVWYDAPEVPVPTDRDGVRYRPFDLLGRRGDAGFDLIAVNVYTGSRELERPWFPDGVHLMQRDSGLPVIVSEFSVRARIDGWSNRGGAAAFVPHDDGTDDQIQRGASYRSQLEQLIGFRGIVGAVWHAWSDRYLAGDPDHQINMGLVQCDDPVRGFAAGRRWDEVDDRIAEVNCDILARIEAITGL